MSKRGKRRGRPPSSEDRVILPESVRQVTESSHSVEHAAKSSGIRRHAKRFWQSAIETAYQYFWTAVITAMIALVVAISIGLWLFVTSEKGAWAFPVLYYIAGIVSGCLLVVGFTMLAILVKSRWRRAQINAKFLSTEKGYLDHLANRDRAQKEFDTLLTAMANEMRRIGRDVRKTTSKLGTQPSVIRRQQTAARAAKHMNKSSEKTEVHLQNFEAITNLLIESSEGFLEWFEPNTSEERAMLVNDRSAYLGLLESVEPTLAMLESYRSAQISGRGISQELNTAVNRMVYSTEGIIATLRRASTHWNAQIALIDTKLRS